MKKNKVILFVVLIIIVIVVAVWAGIMIAGNFMNTNTNKTDTVSPFSAVYLTSGDMYFGKLSWFPSPHLTDVWYLQRTQGQNGQVQVSVQPFTSVFWGPSNEISLNSKNILFTTRLMTSSQVVQAIENPQAAAAQQQGQQIPYSTSSASSAAPMIPAGILPTSTHSGK